MKSDLYTKASMLEWMNSNPILDEDETAYSTDINQFKQGNGYTKWSQLNYVAQMVVDGSNNITGFVNPSNGASVPFPLAGFNPASVAITGGAINGASIGQTTPAAVKTSNLAMSFTDSTGTPGNVTNNSPRGKVSFASGANTIVITNSLVTASSSVIADLNTVDGALNAIVTCLAGAGTITITANAAATTAGLAKCDFIVIN